MADLLSPEEINKYIEKKDPDGIGKCKDCRGWICEAQSQKTAKEIIEIVDDFAHLTFYNFKKKYPDWGDRLGNIGDLYIYLTKHFKVEK